ncbi:hypothetical protein ACJX0J_023963, partial [Zea mays]
IKDARFMLSAPCGMEVFDVYGNGEGRKKLGMTKLIEANKFGKIKHKIKKLNGVNSRYNEAKNRGRLVPQDIKIKKVQRNKLVYCMIYFYLYMHI